MTVSVTATRTPSSCSMRDASSRSARRPPTLRAPPVTCRGSNRSHLADPATGISLSAMPATARLRRSALMPTADRDGGRRPSRCPARPGWAGATRSGSMGEHHQVGGLDRLEHPGPGTAASTPSYRTPLTSSAPAALDPVLLEVQVRVLSDPSSPRRESPPGPRSSAGSGGRRRTGGQRGPWLPTTKRPREAACPVQVGGKVEVTEAEPGMVGVERAEAPRWPGRSRPGGPIRARGRTPPTSRSPSPDPARRGAHASRGRPRC